FELLPYLPLSARSRLFLAKALLGLLDMSLVLLFPLRVYGFLFPFELLARLLQDAGIGLQGGELLLVALMRLFELALQILQGHAQTFRLALRLCQFLLGGRVLVGACSQFIADLFELLLQRG